MLRKIVVVSVCTILGLAIIGATYQSIRSDQDLEKFPPPGELYLVDGLNLHLDCRGSGSPTVLFESGLLSGSSSWLLVHDDIAAHTRVCAYDRPGMDWSDPIKHKAPAAEVAVRLHALIQKAQIADDIILVGMSAGGIYAREYYHKYPDQISAMVLVDSSHEQQDHRLPTTSSDDTFENALSACRMLQPLGLMRVSGTLDAAAAKWFAQLDPKLIPAFAASMNRSGRCSSLYREWMSFPEETYDIEPPRDLGDLPLIVLSQGKEPEADPDLGITLEDARAFATTWNILQDELTALSTQGRRYIAENSGHIIQFEQPQLVTEKILELVQVIREK